MRVQVRKCRFTGKIFEEKDLKKYATHLRNLRAQRTEQFKLDKVKATFKVWLRKEKKNITDVNDIPAWFLKNQQMIMDACNATKFSEEFYRKDKFVKGDKFVKLEWSSVRYKKNASNSHVCPDKGTKNWCAKNPDLPTGYKGWEGHLNGSLSRPKNAYSYPYSEALNIVGIKTASGGGGNESFGYGFTVFLDDWPGLKHTVDLMEQDEIVEKLKGVR